MTFVSGRMDWLAGYFDGDNYIQHNPQIADKLSGLGAALHWDVIEVVPPHADWKNDNGKF